MNACLLISLVILFTIIFISSCETVDRRSTSTSVVKTTNSRPQAFRTDNSREKIYRPTVKPRTYYTPVPTGSFDRF